MPDYEAVISNRDGDEQYRLTGSDHNRWPGEDTGYGGFLSLEYIKEVNAPGLLTFAIDADHPLVSEIGLDWQVEVRRRDTTVGLDWYTDFGGLFRAARRRTDREGRRTWQALCPGWAHYLTRAACLYPANTTDRTVFSSEAAETIMKTLVTRNATSSGTTGDGRDRDVDSWGANISVQADGGLGNALDYTCARKNLMAALREVAAIGGGDFDLVKTDAQAWQFRWYSGQLGTDRRDSLVFSLDYANMENPDLFENYIDYPTVAIVAGQGEEAARQIEIRTAADHQSLYNSSEAYVEARQYKTSAGLQTQGDIYLEEQRRDRVLLNFDPVQTEAYNYGLQYFHGDIFTARYAEVEAVKQIVRTTVSVVAGNEEIETIKLVTKNV